MTAGDLVGFVADGSVRETVRVQVKDPNQILQIGDYVRIESARKGSFFGVIQDIAISTLRRNFPPFDIDDAILEEYARLRWRKRDVYVRLLYMRRPSGEMRPALDIPDQGDTVLLATQHDLDSIMLGQDPERARFTDVYTIGTLMREGLHVNIRLRELIRLSCGVFGMSGTGKTFFVVPLLGHIIASRLAGVLIYDFHNDYSYTLKGANNEDYPSLKSFSRIAHNVHVYAVGNPVGTSKYYKPIYIHPDDIHITDFTSAFELSEAQQNALNAIYHARMRYSKQGGKENDWLRFFYHAMEESEDGPNAQALKTIVERASIQKNTLRSLNNRVSSVMRAIGYPDTTTIDSSNTIREIISHLSRGDAVVLNFSQVSSDSMLTKLLVAALMRVIWQHYTYVREHERSTALPLLIVLEEAHRFLAEPNNQANIFGRVARELRKYNVTLMIIDQRPSSIAEDVRSQLSTKFVARLGSDDDIRAVAVGTPQSDAFVDLIRRLNSNAHMVVGGTIVPTPTLFQVIPYSQAIASLEPVKDNSGSLHLPETDQRELYRLLRARKEL